jgi:8-oxo-dGTP diphosphatase
LDEGLLLVNHAGLRNGPFWAPPGGGMEFSQSAESNLVREFREETGLEVRVGKLMFVTEFLRPPLHALELFYEVAVTGGHLVTGQDPEMLSGRQLIRDVRFLTTEEIDGMPAEAKHGLFGRVPTSGRIWELNGYFRI